MYVYMSRLDFRNCFPQFAAVVLGRAWSLSTFIR